MAARRNDPSVPELAYRMLDARLSWTTICRELGISRTTLNWYRKHRGYRLDANGERETLPPAVVLYACPGCGLRALERDGHPGCRAA